MASKFNDGHFSSGVRQYAASFAIEPPDNRVKRQSGNENLDNVSFKFDFQYFHCLFK